MLSSYFTAQETYTTESRDLIAANRDYALLWQPNVIKHAELMDTVRAILGVPIHVNSWVRSPALNERIGGVQNSDHTPDADRIGATDFKAPAFGTPYDIARALADPARGLRFRQLIYEHTWVHISSPRRSEPAPKRQVLTLAPGGTYVAGIIRQAGL